MPPPRIGVVVTPLARRRDWFGPAEAGPSTRTLPPRWSTHDTGGDDHQTETIVRMWSCQGAYSRCREPLWR